MLWFWLVACSPDPMPGSLPVAQSAPPSLTTDLSLWRQNPPVAFGDLNGDGRADLGVHFTDVYGEMWGDAVLYGHPDGLVQGYDVSSLGSLSLAAVGAGVDLNHDGANDLVGVDRDTYGAQPPVWSVMLGSPSGLRPARTSLLTTPNPGALAVGDFNGDGRAELVEVTASAFVVRRFDAARVVNAPVGVVLHDAGAGSPTPWDLDDDGYGDLIVNNGSVIRAHFGGPAGLARQAGWSWTGAVLGVAGGPDVDGDGHDDLVFHTRTGVWLVSGGRRDLGAGTLLWSATAPGPSPFGDLTGDLDGDGYGDLVLGHDRVTEVRFGGPDGPTTADALIWSPFPTMAGQAIGPGDVDGDGYPDLVLSAFDQRIQVQRVVVLRGGAGLDLDGDGVLRGDCAPLDASRYPGAAEIGGDGVDQDCSGADECVADLDGDGVGGTVVALVAGCPVVAALDCDDADPAVFPGAADPLGADADCDGRVSCYADVDHDGFATPTLTSALPEDCAAAAGTDCEDGDATRHPGATEDPSDGDDEDCDGVTLCRRDRDGDGWSTAGAPVVAVPGDVCVGAHVASGAGDCDDYDASRHRGAAEIGADGVDQDCDGRDACWVDSDGDGFGGARADGARCASPVAVGGDCDDEAAWVYPGAADQMGVDADCDGVVTCFAIDVDRDSYSPDSSPTVELQATGARPCTFAGYTARTGDCNDADWAFNPAQSERPGEGDRDCDGLWTCAVDADGDGSGATTTVAAPAYPTCMGPGIAPDSLDCDDQDAAVGRATPDLPGNDLDEDCDGRLSCYVDQDADGFAGTNGGFAPPGVTCTAPGWGTSAADCDDLHAATAPNQPEVAGNLVDESCDGLLGCYADLDGDGAGGATTGLGPVAEACAAPGWSVASDDCDDTTIDLAPGATDWPGDGVDQDCAGGDAAITLQGRVVGGVLEVTLSGAIPGARVRLTGARVGPCATGLCIGVNAPALLVDGVADNAGRLLLRRTLPAGVAAPVWVQAWTSAAGHTAQAEIGVLW